MVSEYRIVSEAVAASRHTSGEIARAAKHLGTHPIDEVSRTADSNAIQDISLCNELVGVLETTLLNARRELKV